MSASRRFQPAKATRQSVTLKIALTGPQGAGKTTGAVLLAHGLLRGLHPTVDEETLWGKIAFVDTENGSALYLPGRTLNAATIVDDKGKIAPRYLTIGEFTHIPFAAPYDPESWIEVLGVAEQAGAEVVILDSLTHEWSGSGGILEIKDKMGGKFQDWAVVSPRHQRVIDAIRDSPLHVVACMRSKSDTVIETTTSADGRTKNKPVKIGLKSDQRENIEYEFGLVFSIEHKTHLAVADKDRTGIFDGADPAVIGPAVGQRLAAWTASGVTAPGSTYWLASQLDRIASSVTEEACKAAFAEAWRVGQGLVGQLKVDTLARLKATYDAAKAALSPSTDKPDARPDARQPDAKADAA